MKKIILFPLLSLLVLCGCNNGEKNNFDNASSNGINLSINDYVYSGEKMYNNGFALNKDGKNSGYLLIDAEIVSDELQNNLDNILKNYDQIKSAEIIQVWIIDGQIKQSTIKIHSNKLSIDNYDGGYAHKINSNFYTTDKASQYLLFSDDCMFFDEHTSYGSDRQTFYSKKYLKNKYEKEGKKVISL